jgi:hypothetical protein
MNEQKLFQYLKDNYLPDLVLANNPMSRWDCYSIKYKVRIELKCRRAHYDTLLIEKKKYDSMLQSVEGTQYRPLYINSTPKGIWSFDLNTIKPNWITNRLNPATTDFINNMKVVKEVAYININNGKEIKTF